MAADSGITMPRLVTINSVWRSERIFAIIVFSMILTVFIGTTLTVTVAAKHRGTCGGGDLRPPCGMFAVGLNIYGMIGVTAVSTLATLVTYAARRRPPVLLKTASILSVAAVGVLLLPVLATGNKLGGAFVVILIGPFAAGLLGCAFMCVLIWLSRVTGGWMARRAVFQTK